jgi:hypothetical protein
MCDKKKMSETMSEILSTTCSENNSNDGGDFIRELMREFYTDKLRNLLLDTYNTPSYKHRCIRF